MNEPIQNWTQVKTDIVHRWEGLQADKLESVPHNIHDLTEFIVSEVGEARDEIKKSLLNIINGMPKSKDRFSPRP